MERESSEMKAHELHELKAKLRAAHIPVERFAREADLYTNDAYLILRGAKIGPERRARVLDAARRLGLTDEGSSDEPE
jgi:hypothetical protein